MDLIFEKKSSKSLEETVKDLKEVLARHKFGVLWEMDFKETLKGKGFDLGGNFRLLEICSPALAKGMLEQKIEMGYLLPCRMAVYEKDGAVWVGMQRIREQVRSFGDAALEHTVEEAEPMLMAVIEQAV